MQMDAGLDTGPVFARATIGIGADETAKDLHDRLAGLGGELLVEHLSAILDGTLASEEQAEAEATYAPKIKKSDAKLDWSQPSTELHRHIRAYNPVPGASFDFQGEVIKCWQADVSDAHGELPGKILTTQDKSIVVACGSGSLCLTELQRPGRRRVTAPEFASQFDLNDAIFQ
jgi:methionyl-tRNA formyltransferase